MTLLGVFTFGGLLMLLIWGALAAMSFWIWSATKAKASLLTLIGAILLALPHLLGILGTYIADPLVVLLVGSALVVFGYYLTVKPTVDAKIQALRAKK
jgi:hypothetical protein